VCRAHPYVKRCCAVVVVALCKNQISWIFSVENVRSTTPIQQLYNNPSHEDESHILGPTLM